MSKRKCTFNDQLKKQYPFIQQRSASNVFCSVCSTSFSIASGGKNHITSHLNSGKHKSALKATCATDTIDGFFSSSTLSSRSSKIAAAEAALVYHNVKHNHSFRDMDCTSKLMKKILDSSFSCARTKSEAIIEKVFAHWSMEELKTDLHDAHFVSLYCDSSNHGNQKIFPLLVRYFNEEKGVCVKLLQLKSLGGETSDLVSNYILKTLKDNELCEKLVGFCADNTNMNFGGCARQGTNNVYNKLQSNLGKNIFGIGCAAHIVNNTLQTAADCLPVDIEVILVKIYSYFHIYTVRVEELMDFCNYVSTEYKQIVGYCKTRWLSLLPAITRLIQMFVPLKAYFLSQKKCPQVLQSFFNDDLSEVWLCFIQKQAMMFDTAVKQIEGQVTNVLDVMNVLNDLTKRFENRICDKFIPIEVKNMLSNSNKKLEMEEHILSFYSTCMDYLQKWASPFQNFGCFSWVYLRDVPDWKDVERSLRHISTVLPNVKMDDTILYDEIVCIKTFLLSSNKINEWKSQNLPIDKRWVDVFVNLKQRNIPYKDISKIVHLVLCLPGTNAPTERVFSSMNKIWSSEKNQLHVSTLKAMLLVKTNFDFTCVEMYDKLLCDEHKLNIIHNSEKYKDYDMRD